MLRPFVLIETLPFLTFCRILEKLRVEWRNSTSTQNIKYFIFSSRYRTHNQSRCSHTREPMRHNWPLRETGNNCHILLNSIRTSMYMWLNCSKWFIGYVIPRHVKWGHNELMDCCKPSHISDSYLTNLLQTFSILLYW